MTLQHKLTRMFHKKKLIPKCIYPECHKVRVNGSWIECNKNHGYKNYTGTLCDDHLEEALKYNKIEKRLLERE